VDRLTRFYTQPVVVERYVGRTTKGPTYAAQVTELGKVRPEARLVTTSDGREVTTIATIQFSSTIAAIPAESRITLPAKFGGRRGKVAAESLHDAGIGLAYYEIHVEGGA